MAEKIRRTVSYDPEADADIAAWWEAQANASEAVRTAIRFYVAHEENGEATLAQVLEAVHDVKRTILERSLAAPQGATEEPPEIRDALSDLGV